MPGRLRIHFQPPVCHNGCWLLDVYRFVRGGVGHASRYTLMNADKLTAILQQIAHVLRENGHTGQADYVAAIQTIAGWDSSAIAPALTSGAMWGGSGAVWEVGEFESPDDRLSFWQLLIELVAEMRRAGIQSDGSDFVARMLKDWISTGV